MVISKLVEHLSLNLLGPFQARLGGEPLTGFVSHKSRALLAYLAVESDLPQPREKLAGLLWPECPDQSARNNLRFTLSSLRKTIGEASAENPALCVTRQTIQFNPQGDSWVDAVTFSQLLNRQAPRLENLQAAIELYRGEFLEGFAPSGSIAYEEWLLLKREQYHRQALSALFQAAGLHAARCEYDLALPYAWRQVALEPWREESHRQLMRLLALDGQRSAALAQFEVCRRALAQELNVEPAQETILLYQQICNEELEGGRSLPSAAGAVAAAGERGKIIPDEETRIAGSGRKRRGSFKRIGLVVGIALLAIAWLLVLVWLVSGGRLIGEGRPGGEGLGGEARIALVVEMWQTGGARRLHVPGVETQHAVGVERLYTPVVETLHTPVVETLHATSLRAIMDQRRLHS